MRKYHVCMTTTVEQTCTVEIEAESLEAAKARALHMGYADCVGAVWEDGDDGTSPRAYFVANKDDPRESADIEGED